MQKSKMAVWGGLTKAVKRREVKSKGAKERYKHLNAKFQRSRGTRDPIANICWIMEKAREFQKYIVFCFID